MVAGQSWSSLTSCCIIELGEMPAANTLAHVAVSNLQQAAGTIETLDTLATWLAEGLQASRQQSTMFSLRQTFPPLPKKLVKKIQTGKYVDFAELLPDNIGY